MGLLWSGFWFEAGDSLSQTPSGMYASRSHGPRARPCLAGAGGWGGIAAGGLIQKYEVVPLAGVDGGERE